ncbi:MAG: dTDP-4-amino-4,6-dideoxygalactose transaminase [Verrucomicrobia bacterium]|nr:dTDP-4-amino-4,6-dideoxygalactose transaminase [Verrucomicrobiota bacterium]
MRVAFNKPTFLGNEPDYVSSAARAGNVSGGGDFTARCQQLLQRQLGSARVFLTTSCTSALELAALLISLAPGDEVIVPSFSFVSSANAFALRGARPVFADSRPDTLNMDEAKLEPLITRRTKAIVAMHYAGIACEMDSINEIAERHGVPVIEDNAHGLFATYKGRQLGSLGCMGTQSFHGTKNFTCGEGGALLINDASYIPKAELAWEKGTDRLRFMRGQVEKYTWVSLGSSFLLSDLLAAYLFAQLERREEITRQRQATWNYYYDNLEQWANESQIRLPIIPNHCSNPYHLFYLVLPDAEQRTRLMQHLAAHEIESAFHYVPLHTSPMGKRFGGRQGTCPVVEEMSERLLRLPFYTGLTEHELARVVAVLHEFEPVTS